MNGVDMRTKFIRMAVQFGSLTLGILLLSSVLQAQDKSNRSTWTWNDSDGPTKIEVKVENKVNFNEDYSDVASIPYDGALRIYDSRGPRARRLVISAAPNGELRRDYWVDDQVRPFDVEARTWFRGVLLEAVRQGLDAKNRDGG